jgi:hypothetical protein
MDRTRLTVLCDDCKRRSDELLVGVQIFAGYVFFEDGMEFGVHGLKVRLHDSYKIVGAVFKRL